MAIDRQSSMDVRDSRADGSYIAMQLDALSSAATSADLGIPLDGSAPFSIDAWIRFNGLPPLASALSKDGAFVFGSMGNSVVFQFNGLGEVVSDANQGVLKDNSWHYICVTFDGSTLRLYLDGAFNTVASFSGKGQTSSSAILIGSQIQGLVRRVRVYSTPLTAEVVLANMFGTPSAGTLVADFDFSVVPPVDHGPRANPISLQNAAQMIKVSPALSLGTSGFARPFGDRAINPGGAQVDPYTVQAWVLVATSTNSRQAIFVNSDLQSNTGIALLLEYDATVSGYRVVSQRGSNNESSQTLTSKGVVQIGSWTNVATTFDGAKLSIFLQGLPDASMDCGPIPLYRPQSDLLIGAALAQGIPVGATTFQGFIREVDVYTRALLATEILENLTDLPDVNDPTLVGAYNFTSSPARNQANGHPIGLAEGAVLSGHLGPASASTITLRDEAPFPAPCLDIETLEELRASVDFGSLWKIHEADLRAAMEADVAAFSDPRDQSRVRDAWAKVLEKIADAPERMPLWVTRHRHLGEQLLVCHTPRGSYVAFRAPEDSIPDCLLWKIHLVFIIVAGALDAFTGVGAKLTDKAIAYIRQVLQNAPIAALMAAGNGMRAALIFSILGLLWQAGFLRPLILLVIDVGFWTLVRVAARMILVASGVGSAAVISSLAATAATFIMAYARRPSSCDPLPTVDLASLSFHHDPTSTIDALPIRKNFDTPITAPEWTKGKTVASSAPAAFAITRVAGKVVTLQARFHISETTGQTVRIQALGGGILGAVEPTTVKFDPGGDATLTLQLPNHALAASGIALQDISWTWQYQVGAAEWTTITSTTHRIYVLLDVPTLPWMQGADTQNNQLPWTDVLDHSCTWAAGAATADAAVRAVTEKVNGGIDLTYDTAQGASVYTDNARPQNFLCTQFLKYLGHMGGAGGQVNCTDCASIVTTFSNILGCNVFASTMGEKFRCNQILAIGTTTWVVPFGYGFAYHEVAWTGAGSYKDNLYDACLHLDVGPDPWGTGPHTAELPLAWPFTTTKEFTPDLPIATPFTDTSYRERLSANSADGIGKTNPKGPWNYAAGGRRPVR
ncbi:LamG domain-containing protein [Archangium violaceum]|uniref:LamG-like jellyroll fold domain-containing protein n=1 Tax=Archangium violaceum Cb vi76 TaxID=1406225 RepID=A0A084SVX6_9BACT|nr:LamG domain-containing protein [Archangium violaceum]KFA92611.1 hypothetical protein Q664_14285 [Archangium violaceum Cb vi76]